MSPTTLGRVIVVDDEVRWMNALVEALTGFTRNELINSTFKNYFTEPFRADEGIRDHALN